MSLHDVTVTGSTPALRGAPASVGRAPLRTAWSIGAAATLLALLGSWIPSLWGDEAASVLSAQRSLPSLFRMLGHVDAVHGTYYVGLHVWVHVFGTSPFAVRFPSAVAVGLGAVAVVLLAQRLGGPRLALMTGLVYCLLPRVTYMGEETRAYAFDAAIAAWLLLLLVDLVRRELSPTGRAGRIRWLVYGALLTLGIYAFLYMALFLVVHALILASARVPRSTWRRWLVTAGSAVVAASPVVVFSILERSQVAFLASRNTTSFPSLSVGLWFTSWWVAVAAWTLIAVAAFGWIRRIARRAAQVIDAAPVTGARAVATVRRRASGPQPSAEVVAFTWLLVPAILLLASTLVVADFSGRYLSMSAPAAALAIGIGIDRLASRRVGFGIAATAVVLALCVPTYLSQRTPFAKNQSDWAEISATVAAHDAPGQAVVFDESTRPSKRPRLAYRTYPHGFTGLADVTLSTPYWETDTWHDAALTVPQALSAGRLNGYTTVWLIEYATPSHVDSYGRAALEAAGFSVSASYRTHRAVVLELIHGHVPNPS
jgi:mannosyltransferase